MPAVKGRQAAKSLGREYPEGPTAIEHQKPPVARCVAVEPVIKIGVIEGVLILAGSFCVSATLWIGLQVSVRWAQSDSHEMAPEIAFLFLPVLCLPCVLVIVPLHALAARLFAYESWRQWAAAGSLYSAVFVLIIVPWAAIVPALINPITLRIYEWMRRRSAGRDA